MAQNRILLHVLITNPLLVIGHRTEGSVPSYCRPDKAGHYALRFAALHQLRTPLRRIVEHFVHRVAALQVRAQLAEPGDERIERGADVVSIGLSLIHISEPTRLLSI